MTDIVKNIPYSNESMLSPNFTKRQREITQYAYRKGYFQSPKKIDSEEIAQHFNISKAAVTDHLRKATELSLKYFFS